MKKTVLVDILWIPVHDAPDNSTPIVLVSVAQCASGSVGFKALRLFTPTGIEILGRSECHGVADGTFADASLRLSEALEELESEMLREQNPTPGPESSFEIDADHGRAGTIEYLKQCVAALKEDPTSASNTRSLRHSRSLNHLVEDFAVEEHPALQAYERLRLTNAMIRTVFRVTGLGQGVSDDSDKQDPTSPSEDEGDPVRNAGLTVVSPDSGEVVLDDATQHLLLGTSTQHLPLPGAEQVFEADTGGGVVFSRERSKLTRGERIKMAKARRESGGGGIGLGFSTDLFVAEKRGIEKWGPGGEVVQELKDVIWTFGEQSSRSTDVVHYFRICFSTMTVVALTILVGRGLYKTIDKRRKGRAERRRTAGEATSGQPIVEPSTSHTTRRAQYQRRNNREFDDGEYSSLAGQRGDGPESEESRISRRNAAIDALDFENASNSKNSVGGPQGEDAVASGSCKRID
ncbi:hypothetical protein K443DRAFT_120938 [Laccaria amethystina LaAM-08-1]|uniref:Uncharacterized protein n=1 Tax=Laccaria amethystina LaAM-08-1 TaxID=1095629 RepID=A0A0C9Y999_9AGAR|nr:hypothetical protein K443DRAFT_120938 [Laccaria amethystina LaAM-08-1]